MKGINAKCHQQGGYFNKPLGCKPAVHFDLGMGADRLGSSTVKCKRTSLYVNELALLLDRKHQKSGLLLNQVPCQLIIEHNHLQPAQN